MKVGKVRMGEKFALDDRGGVWEKTGDFSNGEVKARCFFGSREAYGTEVAISPDAYCYVMFEDRPKPFGRDTVPRELASASSGLKVRIIDDQKDILVREIESVSPAELSALMTSERMRLIPTGKQELTTFTRSEVDYDLEEHILYLLVNLEERDEDDRRDRSDHQQ